MSKSLCVSCANLPHKDAGLAVMTQQCPECKATFGVTSYGAAFRIKPVKRIFTMSPLVFTCLMIAAGLFMLVVFLAGLSFWTKEQVVARTKPRPSDPPAPMTLARVAEIGVDERLPSNVAPATAKQRIQQLIAQIKNENSVRQDHFIVMNMERRPELRGMPFVMGDACRMPPDKSNSFQSAVEAVRTGFDHDSGRFSHKHDKDAHHTAFWDGYARQSGPQGVDNPPAIAALSQMIGPERRTLRAGLVQRMSSVNRPEATKLLARAAVFDVDLDVRETAIKALKEGNRSKDDVGDILLQGIRYPLASIAKQAAAAMLALERSDLLPNLAAFLDEKAPGDPQEKNGVHSVREVVKINHHHNCLLCHPPAQTGQPNEVPGVMPIPGSPFPTSPSEAYGSARSTGDPMVRADTTYLRQDFSVMMPVENHGAWPEMQRFDFLVRERVVEGKELATMTRLVAARPADYLSENHKAALLVLRRLTGEDAAPNQAAWLRVIGARD